MIKPFKFFSGTRIQYILINTNYTNTTYSIPLDMYGHIMEVAVGLHRENMTLFSPVEYRVENEIGEGVTYFYKINNIEPYFIIPNRIVIEYSVKFPDTEYYCDFATQENISLYETI
jgi:hypothetical protein